MYSVCIIAGLVCVALVLTVLTNPSINIGKYHIRIFYWTAPVLGSIALLLFRLLPLPVMWEGLTSSGSINPLKILTLFISMTTLSIYLDEVGFFSYIAGISLKFAKTSQLRLFCVLFLLVSVLTVFTSNDIIILTFTPFICYFSKKAEIDPMPYLFGEFVAANTWSMMLIIGNPTNIYLATANGIGFGTYTAHMLLPTLFAGITAFLLLLMIFRKPLSQPISIKEEKPAIRDKGLVIIGLLHLVFCTILLILSSYIGLEMWYITLGFAVSLFLCVTIYKKKKGVKERVLLHTIMRAPWELIPFVLSMFLLVLTLDRYQVTTIISDFFGTNHLVWKYGIASFLAANVMNNIPMSVAFSSIVSHLPEADRLPAAYASIIGSNIGAYFTPLGALAGIMWSGILNKMGIPFSFRKYISYGIRISIPVLIAALLGLLIYF
ncbi:MAG: ArsB/NhaD family transporter [Lachnospiraceae bacterium]|nr:ArsB/NhaD family transporter [Clostridium sp.]MDY4820395.1 ArsB/NhaD family transporter [Lachnospiraceae bacterium]